MLLDLQCIPVQVENHGWSQLIATESWPQFQLSGLGRGNFMAHRNGTSLVLLICGVTTTCGTGPVFGENSVAPRVRVLVSKWDEMLTSRRRTCRIDKISKETYNLSCWILNKKSRIYGTSDQSVYLSIRIERESAPESAPERIRSRENPLPICSLFSASDWLREVTWQMGADSLGSGFSWEQIREWIPEPLIGSDRSHDKWEWILSGADSGGDSWASDWIGRSVTANDRRERIWERIWERIQQISNFWYQ